MCCMLQNSQTPETCTADGLCRTYDNTVLARGTCTDPTWKDPACLDLCLSGESKNPCLLSLRVSVYEKNRVLFEGLVIDVF